MSSATGPRVARRRAVPVKVTAVLVLGDPSRLTRARVAVDHFARQLGPPDRRLVVVNGSGAGPVLTVPAPGFSEIEVTAGSGWGELYQLGLDQAGEDSLIAPWPDDVYFHPERLLRQLPYRNDHGLVLLGRQIRVNLLTASAFYYTALEQGINETVLHLPTRCRCRPEDTLATFMERAWPTWPGPGFVYDNAAGRPPESVLSVAFYHPHHEEEEASWMGPGRDQIRPGRSYLTPPDLAYLTKIVFPFYGLEANIRPSATASTAPAATQEAP